MKKLILLAALFAALFCIAQTNPNHVYVSGYYRSNGTYVAPHYRTAPNSTVNDNFSTQGNYNPYTGEAGYLPRDNYSPSLPTKVSFPSLPSSIPRPITSSIPADMYLTPEKLKELYNKQIERNSFETPNSTVLGGKYFLNSGGKKNYIVQSL